MSELSLEDDFRPQRFGRANRGRSFSDDSLTSSEDGLSDYEVSRPSQVNLRNRAGSFTSNAEAPISAYQYDGLESEFDRGSSYVGPRPQRRPTVYQAPHYGGPESEFDRGSSYVGSRPQRRPTVYQARDSESHSESGSSEFDDAASMQGMPGDGPMGEIEPAPVEEAQQQEAPNEQVVPEPQPGGIALPSSRQSLIDDESLSRASNAGEERGLRPVGVDREMVPAQFGVDVQTGPVPGSSAGVGKLGGGRGKWNHATKNPLFMFPKRAYTAIKALSVGIGKLVKRGWKRLFGKKKAEAADANAVDANAAPAQGAEVEGAEVEGAEVEGAEVNAGPTIEVDESTAYGKRMIAKEQAREQFSDYQARNPDGAIPGEVPQGWTDTKFGSANSLLTRLRAGDTTTEAERDYMHAMNAKAMAITKQREEASPENPSAFPFAQKTQADAEDTGVAKAGHFVTATGAAINDREEMRPDEGTNAAGAKAWDALNIGTNAIKAGTKFVDRQIKNYADKDYDEKVLGGAGKAYLETGKAAQFTYGFVGKDVAKGYDAVKGGTAGKDLTNELDPYLGIKNYDRVAQTNVELLSGKPGLMYSKNFNAGSAGKYVENVANVAQAAGTGLTEMFGKPFEKMHAKRGELLSDQFVTTVARRKLQAERANRDRLIDDHVDPERQGVPTFLNANAEMLQAGAREYRSAQRLGKQAQQEGYASNFGLDMDTTAMLNDMKHRRRHGAAFNTAMNAKRAAEANIAEKTALDAARGTDDEQKVKEEAAAKLIAAKYFRSKAWRKKGREAEAAAQVEDASTADAAEYGERQRSNIPEADALKELSPLTWKSRKERTDGVDKQQWRGLWNERAQPIDRSLAIQEAEAARGAAILGESVDDSQAHPLIEEEMSSAGDVDGPVMGREVRRRAGFGRALAGVGQGVGKALSTTGAVIGFDNGENDLKQGNLKTATAKAAMSEVYQNGLTGGLGYIPYVGPYAKTFGLAALTPIGEGVRLAGEGLEEAAFGKENRDRRYNAHWGLESSNATDKTREQRQALRETEAQQAEGLSSGAEGPARLKQTYVDQVAKYNALKAGRAEDDPALVEAGQAVTQAREDVLGGIRNLRDTEQGLGYNRRRELARTGLVDFQRAESPFVQPQVPLTEEKLASHRERYPDQLSAALPKQVQVYKSKAAVQPAAAEAIAQDNPLANAPDFNVDDVEGNDGAGRASARENPVVDPSDFDVDDDEGSGAFRFGGFSLAGGESQGGDPRPREDDPSYEDAGSGGGMNYVSPFEQALAAWQERNPGRR